MNTNKKQIHRKYTEDDDAKIVELFNRGISSTTIARQLNFGYTHINTVIHRQKSKESVWEQKIFHPRSAEQMRNDRKQIPGSKIPLPTAARLMAGR